MRKESLSNMIKGWFVGNFEPAVLRTDAVEVAVKEYGKGDHEASHYHKIATELTLVVYGRIRMKDMTYGKGDIVIVEPGETTDFEALEDSVCTVVKYPGASNDKYREGEETNA